MKGRFPIQGNKKPGKKASAKKQQLSSVKVRLGAIRNFSVSQLASLGVMTVMAVFGIFLATQIVSPQSSATASTIALKQVETNQVEAVISGSSYAPRFVSHVVSDESTCDDGLFNNSAIRPKVRHDPYFIFEDIEGWDERKNYQGDDSDNWATMWEADNSHTFKFLFPILSGNDFGYIGRKAVGQPAGKYLCMRVTYNDNNADLKDFKQISLLTLEEPVHEDANYELTANQSVYWSVEKADDNTFDTCEEAISTSGQTSTSFTFETTKSDHYGHFCVRARNASGIQVYKLIQVFPPEEEETIEEITTKDVKETEGDFTVTIKQYISGDIKITASLFIPGNAVISSWKYAIVDADVVSVDKKKDCQPFFGSGSPSGLLVSAQTIVSQKVNEASTDISTQYSGDWICVQATDQAGGIGYDYIKLLEEEVPPEPEEPEPQDDNQDEQNDQDQGNEENGQETPPTTTTNKLPTKEVDQREEDVVSAVNQSSIGSGGAETQDEQTAEIIKTGFFSDQNNWIRLGGYILAAIAVLGIIRILIVKKCKNIDK